MKHIKTSLTLIYLLANTLISTAQNTDKTNPNWDFIKTYFLNDKNGISLFKEDINVQLIGNYSKTDSIFISNMVNDLKHYIGTVNIQMVKDDGNFEVIINGDNKRTDDFDEGIKFGGGFSMSPRDSSVGSTKIRLNFNDSIAQIQRNKAIQFFIIRRLIPLNKFFLDAISYPNKKIYNTEKDINKQGVFSNSNYKNVSFNEFDKNLIKMVYSKEFYFKFYCHYPKILFKSITSDLLDNSNPLSPKDLPTTWSVMAFIILSILILRFYNFNVSNKNWFKYCIHGIILTFPLFIFSVDEIIYLNNTAYRGINAPTLKAFVMLVYTLFIGIIVGSIYYFTTKLILLKSTNNSIKYILLFIIISISGFTGLLLVSNTFSLPSSHKNAIIIYVVLIAIIQYSINILNENSSKKLKEKELELARMEELKSKAELQAIQSRINPHFLYNSLNSLASLAITDPKKTRNMALSLSEFFKFAINKKNEENILISDEIKMIKSYLEIEKIRFGEKLNYSIHIEKDIENLTIPKFIIQPLIENAIKHGISISTESSIVKLLIKKENEGIFIEVFDDGPEFPNNAIYGYGLQSIYDKLELIYKGNAKINWTNTPLKKISIWLPIQSN